MAKPAKRKVEGSSTPVASKRVTPRPGSTEPSGRYTAPTSAARHAPSPRWVPVLMFSLWGLGLLLIVLNYMGVLPGSADGGNGWYLVGGLGAILAGIMVATQYR